MNMLEATIITILATISEDSDILTPLWNFLSNIGKSIAGMWFSIVVLTISGTGFLIIYLRRKSFAVKYSDDE